MKNSFTTKQNDRWNQQQPMDPPWGAIPEDLKTKAPHWLAQLKSLDDWEFPKKSGSASDGNVDVERAKSYPNYI